MNKPMCKVCYGSIPSDSDCRCEKNIHCQLSCCFQAMGLKKLKQSKASPERDPNAIYKWAHGIREESQSAMFEKLEKRIEYIEYLCEEMNEQLTTIRNFISILDLKNGEKEQIIQY